MKTCSPPPEGGGFLRPRYGKRERVVGFSPVFRCKGNHFLDKANALTSRTKNPKTVLKSSKLRSKSIKVGVSGDFNKQNRKGDMLYAVQNRGVLNNSGARGQGPEVRGQRSGDQRSGDQRSGGLPSALILPHNKKPRRSGAFAICKNQSLRLLRPPRRLSRSRSRSRSREPSLLGLLGVSSTSFSGLRPSTLMRAFLLERFSLP